MLIHQSIPPTTLTIITTFKCSAACNNCCFECNPGRKEKLPLSSAISHINYAISRFKKLQVVVLTGGECFLDMSYLLTLIKHIRSLNLICRVVTNGFWAKSEETAYDILHKCKEAGLNEINFSTGDENLEYVPIEHMKKAIYVAAKLNLTVIVNIEYGKDRKFKVENLLEDLTITKYASIQKSAPPKLSIINGLWMPFTKEALSHLPYLNKKAHHPCKERCSNLFNTLTISPDNRLLACCGLPVLYIKYLDLGNLNIYPLDVLYNKQFSDFIKIWLFVDGPYKILSFIESKLGIELPECRVLSHTCFYCAALFTNPTYLAAAQKYYKEIFSSIMLRYAFLVKQLA